MDFNLKTSIVLTHAELRRSRKYMDFNAVSGGGVGE
jgi:hypothetical protein